MLVHQPPSQEEHGFRLGHTLWLLGGVIALLVLGASVAAAEIDNSQEIIREKVEQLRLFKSLKIGDASVTSSLVVPDFYERREFQLAWVKHTSI